MQTNRTFNLLENWFTKLRGHHFCHTFRHTLALGLLLTFISIYFSLPRWFVRIWVALLSIPFILFAVSLIHTGFSAPGYDNNQEADREHTEVKK